MGEVIQLNIDTLVDIPADDVLDGAKDACLDTVFVVGERPDGSLYIAGSSSDSALNGWLLDHAKLRLLRLSEPE